jgi:hypothetical protein
MDFSHSNVDARQSSFNHAGRDLHQTIRNVHYHIYISPCGSRRRPHRIAVDIGNKLPLPNRNPVILPQGCLVADCSSDAVAVVDAAVDLIDQIAELLKDWRDSSTSHLDLALELQSLQKTLILTGLAIQKYDSKPLGRSLADTIVPEVLRCFVVLQELLYSINGAWLGFSITSVGGFWRRIWWGGRDGDSFASLRKKLSDSRQALQGLLMALHSYVLVVLYPPFR